MGFIYKFPLIMNHWRNCLQTGDKSLGPPGQEETLFTFDFPFGTGLPTPGLARLCQPLLFSEVEVLSVCPPCCVNRTQGWRPSPTLEMSLPSAAWLLPPHIRRLLSSDEGSWVAARRSWGFALCGPPSALMKGQ